jgi:bifunctional UDP-N-acetylglucosamine pyrophosphorylase/glucosamine-1-phosphate N-acetyltransferase
MQAVIMAAGESSRFWPLNYQHKTLFKICGKPLIASLIEEIRKTGIKDIIIVQGPSRDIGKELKDKSLKYVVQKRPTGTGDAILAAEKLIRDKQFFVLNADDTDVKENLKRISQKLEKGKNKIILLASRTKTPWLFGILKIRGDRVLEIVEKPKRGQEPSNLKNDNFFLFPREFLGYLKKVPSHPFSLIHALNLYARENKIEVAMSKRETLSLKYPWHLFATLQKKLNPSDFKTRIAKSAKIGKNTVISGKVIIGEGTKIGPNTTINGPCYIGKNCDLGASNVLRGPLSLEDGVKTGAFMEIKESIIQASTHFHSGYLGNSLIGRDCRFGAGFVVANRRIDRQNIFSHVKGEKIDTDLTYFGTVIGSNTKVGIQVGVMPGVFIGSHCVIWPGNLVFNNVPDNTMLKNSQKSGIDVKTLNKVFKHP